MNTSLRSHGKWGDFLVALIPLAWCGNILVNSNFILRMIEWQNESTLFTVRIQGKQWYWVYKYNADTNYKLYNVYYNVGNNNWMKTTAPSDNSFNYNNTILNFVYDYEFKTIHLANMKKYHLRNNPLNLYSLQGSIRKTRDVTYYTLDNYFDMSKSYKQVNLNINSLKINKYISSSKFLANNYNAFKYRYNLPTKLPKNLLDVKAYSKLLKLNNPFEDGLYSNYFNEKYKSWYIFLGNRVKKRKKWRIKMDRGVVETLQDQGKMVNHFNLFDYEDIHDYRGVIMETEKLDELIEPSETTKIKSYKYPVRLIKGTLNKHNLAILRKDSNINRAVFFNYKVPKQEVALKNSLVEPFWGFRQKRYKKMRYFLFPTHRKYNSITYTYIKNFLKNQPIKTYQLYTAVKNNKYKNELMPVTLARRLLRTKRTLILPAHINITLITNSYDVIHSWFVPGLGLKIDCVPGRSTHHTLYIDNIGFYYGQCAEICGRYHHHMPIRVCALPYEHFMLWWQTKGMPRMYRSKFFIKNKNVVMEKFKY